MTRKILKILLFVYLGTYSKVSPQSPSYKNFTFEHLSIEHGLSQITVHSILQDSKGFLWFGTEDGLNRYDGYNFVVYRHNPEDSNSISDNFIWSIFEDSDKNIWIGTNGGGLNKYSYSSNSFSTYINNFPNNSSFGSNNIRLIFEDSSNNLWIGTNNAGLYKFNKSNNSFQEFALLEKTNYSIRAMCEDLNGVLWIGTNDNGLFAYNKEKNKTNHYATSIDNQSTINSNSIWSLTADKENNIWIGTYEGGLNKYDRKTNKFQKFISNGTPATLINNNVTSILIDDYGNPWICTEGGLSIYNQKSKDFSNYKHNLSDLRSLSNSFLRFITKGNSNLIWIGSVGGGVNKVNQSKKFNQFNHNPIDENSLSHNMIRAIEEDSKGNMWIGTMGGGLNRFDKLSNTFQRFNSKKNGLSEDVVTSILEDEYNNLWIGTWGGGLNKIQFVKNSPDYRIKKIEKFSPNPNNSNSLSSSIIQDIFEDSRNNLWIGTEGGLDRFDLKSNTFEHFRNDPNNEKSISDNRIQSSCILEDRFGYLWVGTWQGLNRIKVNDINNNDSVVKNEFQRISKKNGLSDNRVISIYEGKTITNSDSLTIWIGTVGGGLNKILLKTNKGLIEDYTIINYSEMNGLPSNVIYGILGDNDGNLWMSTNNGISKFNPITRQFRNFDMQDGLQSNQFFYGAFDEAKDGELYFGGINGLNSFYPNKIVENKNIPPLFITKFSVESSDGSHNLVIDNIEQLSNDKSIDLPYDSYNIQFVFTALDLTTPGKNKYKYILENYDEKWVENNYSNTASYTNVNDGTYIFNVIGSNNDGVWNTRGSFLNIIIETPFWKTWWFILFVISVISGLIAYFIVTQIKNILAVERLRTKLAADLHDNIGSSLTEISILSEVITTRLKTEDADIKKSLDKISYKSRNLIDKMSDIVWLVNPQRDSLYDLILRLQDTYSDLLSDTEISFRSENLKSLEKVSLSMEHRQHLFLIFKEAINNSITHSNCTELILNASVSGRTTTMFLKDNGIGFNFDENNQGNGLKNMKSRAKKIGGKLFISSEVGKGTVIKYIGNIR